MHRWVNIASPSLVPLRTSASSVACPHLRKLPRQHTDTHRHTQTADAIAMVCCFPQKAPTHNELQRRHRIGRERESTQGKIVAIMTVCLMRKMKTTREDSVCVCSARSSLNDELKMGEIESKTLRSRRITQHNTRLVSGLHYLVVIVVLPTEPVSCLAAAASFASELLCTDGRELSGLFQIFAGTHSVYPSIHPSIRLIVVIFQPSAVSVLVVVVV